jgi:aspartate racemase
MIHATVTAASARSQGRVGLVASRGTRVSGLYDRAAASLGLDLVHAPDRDQSSLVDEAVRMVKQEGPSGLAERLIEQAARSLYVRGCDLVLAACTEIPLVLRRAEALLPVVDTVRCLALACVERFSGVGTTSANGWVRAG